MLVEARPERRPLVPGATPLHWACWRLRGGGRLRSACRRLRGGGRLRSACRRLRGGGRLRSACSPTRGGSQQPRGDRNCIRSSALTLVIGSIHGHPTHGRGRRTVYRGESLTPLGDGA